MTDPETDQPSEALREFLATELGQMAEQRGLGAKLQRLQTYRPPTVELYAQLATIILLGNAS